MEIKPISVFTIGKKTPIYKGDEPAERIELINLVEVGFDLIAQKDLYEIGDRAVYIQPDYCLSDIELFESFIRPINRKTNEPDEDISMLGRIEGRPRRIRAKKFSFSKEPNGPHIYSNGILIPLNEFQNYLVREGLWDKMDSNWDNVSELLGVHKYIASENVSGGGKLPYMVDFPTNLYKTDEDNIMNIKNSIRFPIKLVGTLKNDGGSITLGILNKEKVICSRNNRILLQYKKIIGRVKLSFIDRVKKLFGCKFDEFDYKMVDTSTVTPYAKYGKPYVDVMDELNFDNIVLRGELIGQELKGSGKEFNPQSKLPTTIKFFGADFVNEFGVATKIHYDGFLELLCVLSNNKHHVNFTPVEEIFNQEFGSFEELIDVCKNYFKDNLVEGIVVRTNDGLFSAKVMNDEYDSRK